ncbi:MAG TPA: carboxylating nicotinate-nucleotide diphosphorylase [Dehalococcoidia bacterium]|nr:carboxylating nicotinate-nucleotide diphosphorylase [Dehalococcoidia bacterium]
MRSLVEAALMEDRAQDDITTSALVPADQRGRATIVAKSEGVLAGVAVAEAAFKAIDASLTWRGEKVDGERISPGDRIAMIEGRLDAILRAERVALNFLAHLSGVASAAATVVALLEGTGCRLRDTRKTTPGLRALEKYAARAGGATNHRFDLADGVLIKDNHLVALRGRLPAGADQIAEAVRLAREAISGKRIEVEVTSVDEALRALQAGADELLLDNMSLQDMKDVVRLVGKRKPRPVLEASGRITVASARAVAETGVDFVSMGAITHSAPALDLSLEVEGA